jgi:glycosyltransferase involved in cell wall biosynthesis
LPLSVVIPAYNEAHALCRALESLSRQTLEPHRFEVVLVDDGSAEDLRSVVDGFTALLDVRYLRNQHNLGRARTRNRGIAAARHDDLLLLDADSFCTTTLLERHERFAGRAAGQILLGRRLEPGWATLRTLLDGRLPQGHHPVEEDPRYRLGFDPGRFPQSRTPWLFAYCHNMSVGRGLLDAVGGFNEEFITWGYEDNELAYRIFRHHGRRSGDFRFDDEAITYHLPHYRNWRADWSSAQRYIPYLKDRYRHFDLELLGAPPQRVAQAVPHYERCLAELRAWAPGTGASGGPPVLAPGPRELRFGFGLGLAGQLRCDHAEEPDDTNLHLLGVSTPFGAQSFDRVVNVDVWRVLDAADLSALVLEGFRIGREVLLVWSRSIDAPIAGNLTYVTALLAPHCRLAVDDSWADVVLLSCRPPESTPATTPGTPDPRP